jgi:L-tyrosine isonitrile synthase
LPAHKVYEIIKIENNLSRDAVMSDTKFEAARPFSEQGLARQMKGARRRLEEERSARVEAVVQAFNSWAFKREQPDDASRLKRLAELAIEQGAPLPFVLYWGRGPRADIAEPERQCLEFLAALARRIEAQHPPGADITLICTDTHASLNGYAPVTTRRYFAGVETAATERGFHACFLSDLVQWAEDRIDRARADDPPARETLGALTVSATKWYRGGGSVEDGAKRYFSANMIERQAVEAAFPDAIFITFNGSDLRPLFPENMPIFYMYSIRRGVAVKPWFMAAEAKAAEPELTP